MPASRDAENKEALAHDAMAILEPELALNKELLANLLPSIAKAEGTSLNYFSVNAWEAMSKGGLLVSLKASDVKRLLRVYNLTYKANYLLGEIREHTLGAAAAFAASPQLVAELNRLLSGTLVDLGTAFQELDRR